MKKVLWCLKLGFTAALVILQPINLLIANGIMVANPVLAAAIHIIFEASKYGRQVIALIEMLSKVP